MILRRLSLSLKQQNWTAIWIEFVLLVAGVFLGIQVSNWNAARADDARAQAYLERIRADLQSDLQSIERREIFWPKVNDYGKAAIHYAETGERVEGSAWKTVLAFYQASQLWQWGPTDATYQELRFWVANQGVTLNVIGNYKVTLNAMLARQPVRGAP